MIRDPIGIRDDLLEEALLYFDTSFGIRDYGGSSISERRNDFYRKGKLLAQQPIIEPLMEYAQSEAKPHHNLESLLSSDPDLVSAGSNLSPEEAKYCSQILKAGLFSDDYPLYEHQWNMIKHVLMDRPAVVTSGTGSGKTECFMAPLVIQLAKESLYWNSPPSPTSGWWRNKRNDFVSQRDPGGERDAGRMPGLRALLLYPMNALVEDQLRRLRQSLDSPEVEAVQTEGGGQRRIYFGRYIGSTPVPGWVDDAPDRKGKTARLRGELDSIDEATDGLHSWIAEAVEAGDGEAAKERREHLTFFPRMDGAEMRSRWDMQTAAPDVLITNVSMLSIMMMREQEDSIFAQTREYLESSDDARFHLIVDELHLSRGSAGSEVAYMLRLLLDRIGLHPGHEKLRIIASSASLEGEDGRHFLEEFFGRASSDFMIEPGRFKEMSGNDPMSPEGGSLASGDPKADHNILASRAKKHDEGASILSDTDWLDEFLGDKAPDDKEARRAAMEARYNEDQWDERIVDFCRDNSVSIKDQNGWSKAQPVASFADLASHLFPSIGEAQAREALRGLMIIKSDIGRGMRVRTHLMMRNAIGISSTAEPGVVPIGEIYESSESHDPSGRRLHEMAYCEVCNTVLLSGYRGQSPERRSIEFLNSDPRLDGLPEEQIKLRVEQRGNDELVVFWPIADQSSRWTTTNQKSVSQPWLRDQGGKSKQFKWRVAVMDPGSGIVRWVNSPGQYEKHLSHLVEAGGVLGLYWDSTADLSDEVRSQICGLPTLCPLCDTSYNRRKSGRKSPIRDFRTGIYEMSQMVSRRLIHALRENDKDAKLVAFSDSRRGAADLAYRLTNRQFSELVKEQSYNLLRKMAIDEPRLVADLVAGNEPDSSGLALIDWCDENQPLEDEKYLPKRWDDQIQTAASPLSIPAFQEAISDSKDRLEVMAERAPGGKNERVVRVRDLTTADSRKAVSMIGRKDKNSPGPLFGTLLRKGFNPGGIAKKTRSGYLLQRFKPGPDKIYIDWTEGIEDWDAKAPQFKPNDGYDGPSFGFMKQNMSDELMRHVMDSWASGSGQIESLGLGNFAIGRISDEELEQIAEELNASFTSADLREICESVIRLQLRSYRYFPRVTHEDIDDKLKRNADSFLKKVAENHQIDYDELKEKVSNIIVDKEGHSGHIIHEPMVRISIPNQTAYRCPICGTGHLHRSAGVCVTCLSPLDDDHRCVAEDLRERDLTASHVENPSEAEKVHWRMPSCPRRTPDSGQNRRPQRDDNHGGRGRHRKPVVGIPGKHASCTLQLPTKGRKGRQKRADTLSGTLLLQG